MATTSGVRYTSLHVRSSAYRTSAAALTHARDALLCTPCLHAHVSTRNTSQTFLSYFPQFFYIILYHCAVQLHLSDALVHLCIFYLFIYFSNYLLHIFDFIIKCNYFFVDDTGKTFEMHPCAICTFLMHHCIRVSKSAYNCANYFNSFLKLNLNMNFSIQCYIIHALCERFTKSRQQTASPTISSALQVPLLLYHLVLFAFCHHKTVLSQLKARVSSMLALCTKVGK